MTFIEKALGPGAPVRSDKGVIIYAAGSLADKVYFVRSGIVLIERFDAAGEVVYLCGPGQYFGESSLARSSGNRTETARVVGRNADIVCWHRDSVRRCVATEATFWNDTLDMLIGKIREYDRRVAISRLKPVRRRIAAILADLGEQVGTRAEKGEVVLPRMTHQCLADMAGTSREITTGAMMAFRKNGYVRYSRGSSIAIFNPQGFRAEGWLKS